MEPRLLIDSHIFIWLLYQPDKINNQTIAMIQAAETVYLSSLSLWELSLKYAKGKLPHGDPDTLLEGVRAVGVTVLPLNPAHVVALPSVRLPHNDPFDAMLLAQSRAEGCRFVTADAAILSSSARTQDARV